MLEASVVRVKAGMIERPLISGGIEQPCVRALEGKAARSLFAGGGADPL